jgi:hypothetical protein
LWDLPPSLGTNYKERCLTAHRFSGDGDEDNGDKVVVIDKEDTPTEEAMAAVAVPSSSWHGDGQVIVNIDDKDNGIDAEHDPAPIHLAMQLNRPGGSCYGCSVKELHLFCDGGDAG